MVDRQQARALGLDFSHAGSNVFFYAVFTLLGKALRLDQRSTADMEQQFMYALRTFGLQNEGQSFAMRAFADGAAAPQSAEACALCLKAHYADDVSLLTAVYEAFCDIVLAGGDLSEREQMTVWSVGRAFDLPAETIDLAITSRRRDRGYTAADPQTVVVRRRRATLPPAVQEAYKQLGVDPLADMTAVRKQYRQLMREYHPDHTETKAMTKGYRDFASQRLHQISEAVACIKAYFAAKRDS